MEKDKITTEELARMIARGFADTATKEDFKRLDGRMAGMENRMDGMENRMGRMENRIDHIDARLSSIEDDVHEMRGNVVYHNEFDDALARLKYVELKLGIESGK